MQIGRNYADHAAEMNAKVPTEPVFFLSECCLIVSRPPAHSQASLTILLRVRDAHLWPCALAEPPSSIVRKGGNIEVPKSIGKVHYEVGTELPSPCCRVGVLSFVNGTAPLEPLVPRRDLPCRWSWLSSWGTV